jgi:hypothetical protein
MKELGPEAHALLEAARGGDDPTGADQERLRAAIATRLVAGAAGGLAVAGAVKSSAAIAGAPGAGASAPIMGASGAGTSAAGALSVGFVVKALVVVALVGMIGTGVTAVVLSHPRPSAPAAVPSTASIDFPAAQEAAHVAANPVTTTSEERMIPPPAGTLAAPSSPRAALVASPPGDVAAEVRLLGAAHRAMRAGEADRALVLLDEHGRRYPRGALGEERDATRIAALCALGHAAEAKEAADRFLRVAPRSLQAAAVRASCGGSPAMSAVGQP